MKEHIESSIDHQQLSTLRFPSPELSGHTVNIYKSIVKQAFKAFIVKCGGPNIVFNVL